MTHHRLMLNRRFKPCVYSDTPPQVGRNLRKWGHYTHLAKVWETGRGKRQNMSSSLIHQKVQNTKNSGQRTLSVCHALFTKILLKFMSFGAFLARDSTMFSALYAIARPSVCPPVCPSVRWVYHRTRKLCYRKDDRAMRAI